MPAKFSNNASSSLAGSLTPSDTALSVNAGEGIRFPILVAGEYFTATITKLAGGLEIREIVKVTARVADTFTIVRAQENTSAQSFDAGAKIDLRVTAGTLASFAQTDSPNFTGTPKAPTPAAGDSSERISTTGFAADLVAGAVAQAKDDLVDEAPSTLDTIGKLAAALGNDPAFLQALATALAARVRTDTASQGLTAAQKTNARANIDAVGTGDTIGIAKGGTGATTAAAALAALGGLPLAGGTMGVGGNITFLNSQGIRATDTAGAVRPMLYLDGINNVNILNAGGQNIRFSNSGGGNIGNFTEGGVFSAPVVTQTSDENKKHNWRPLTDAQLDALAEMSLVGTFEWNDGSGASIGGSAQQIRAIVPEAVHWDEENGFTVNYGGLAFAIQQAMLRRMRASA